MSAAAAIALALFAVTRFLYANVIWDPGYYGTYGLRVDHWSDLAVQRVVPGSPAAAAGIQVGDKVALPSSLHDRLALFRLAPRPNERLTLSVLHAGQHRALALRARPLAPLPIGDRALLVLKFVWLFVFVAVSFVLVLLRPSRMTWGFFLFPFNLAIIFLPSDAFFSYLPSHWFIALRIVEDLLAPAGIVGFLIFAIRFPDNAPTGWRKTIENLAPFLYVAIAGPLMYWDLVNIALSPAAAIPYAFDAVAIAIFAAGALALTRRYVRADGLERRNIAWVIFGLALGVAAAVVGTRKQYVEGGPEQHWTAHAALTLGSVVVLVTYYCARGLERQRIKWVVLGLVCAWVADGADHLGISLGSVYDLKWTVALVEPLYIILPMAVTYAVIRYRVIDARFVMSRSLTFGLIALAAAVVFGGIDWLFSTRLPNSRLETAAYAGAAILIGFSLDAARQRIGTLVDFMLFNPWYHVQQQAHGLEDVIRRSGSLREVYDPLITGVSRAFSLASAAIFERVEGGGFVRAAALGWSPGTLWHILPDDPLLMLLSKKARIVDLDAFPWREGDAPAAAARPAMMIPIRAGGAVPALLLYGAHDTGTGLAPEEERTIRSLCVAAAPVFGVAAARADSSALLEQRV